MQVRSEPVWQNYLVQVLREDLSSCEAELQLLRNSLRYRVGGWMLEALPFGPKTIAVIFRLLKLYAKRLILDGRTGSAPSGFAKQSEVDGLSNFVVFGHSVPSGMPEKGVWKTDDPHLICRRLDSSERCGTLVLRFPAQQVLRRLERARLAGWHVVWCPEVANFDGAVSMTRYASTHADECWESACI